MSRAEFFSVDGGYVLLDPGREGFRFACATDQNDPGVLLQHGECLKLGLALLREVLTPDEEYVLRALVSMAEHRLADPVAP